MLRAEEDVRRAFAKRASVRDDVLWPHGGVGRTLALADVEAGAHPALAATGWCGWSRRSAALGPSRGRSSDKGLRRVRKGYARHRHVANVGALRWLGKAQAVERMRAPWSQGRRWPSRCGGIVPAALGAGSTISEDTHRVCRPPGRRTPRGHSGDMKAMCSSAGWTEEATDTSESNKVVSFARDRAAHRDFLRCPSNVPGVLPWKSN